MLALASSIALSKPNSSSCAMAYEAILRAGAR
jgi:hypothetical protein